MIRILKASPYYESYFHDFFRNHPEAESFNYNQLITSIFNEAIGWSNFWKINLEKDSKFEVIEIISNSYKLQTLWAKENSISYKEDNWLEDILEAQVQYYNPDIFFPHDYVNINSKLIYKIRQKVKSIKLVISYDGFGLGDSKRFNGSDLIISCAQFICDFYSKNGYKTWYMPFGFEPGILDRLVIQSPKHEVSFCGSVIVREQFHNQRLRLLSEISSVIPLTLWASNLPKYWQPWKLDQLRRLKRGKFQEFIDVYRLASINLGSKSGINMYQALADSRFTLNQHIDVSYNVAGNSRLTEATGVGTCLITDHKDNISEFFEPDIEIITFKSADEARDKLKYLSNNESERKKIAEAGQKRTLKEHTFYLRMKDLSDEITRILNT